MIAGATRGNGGKALVNHFLESNPHGQRARPLAPRGLLAEAFGDQLKELIALAAHGRTKKAAHHAHVNPAIGFETEAVFQFWISEYEKEFGLVEQQRIGVEHQKNGRTHRHYVWSLVGTDGRTISLSHDFARREKISRVVEHEFGMPLISGKHNRAVISALRADGRDDVANAMIAAGLDKTIRPVAATTPAERHQQDRTGIAKADVAMLAFAAWRASSSAVELETELQKRGLKLALGDKGPVILDEAGAVRSLSRLVGTESKRVDGQRVGAKEVKARLADHVLKPLTELRQIRVIAPERYQIIPQVDPVSTKADEFAASLKTRSLAWHQRKTIETVAAEKTVAFVHKTEDTLHQKLAREVLDTKLKASSLHADNQLSGRLMQFGVLIARQARELPPVEIPDKLLAARAELARVSGIKSRYVAERGKYNATWTALLERRPNKFNYLAYLAWRGEAEEMNRKRKGLGRQLARINPAHKQIAAAVAKMEAYYEPKIVVARAKRESKIARMTQAAETLVYAAQMAEAGNMKTGSVDEIAALLGTAERKMREDAAAELIMQAVKHEHQEEHHDEIRDDMISDDIEEVAAEEYVLKPR